ncbi:MAG: SRPBCC domain-containing protein [Myxococcaceae bacterium]
MKTISHHLYVAAPAARVWEAITQAEGVKALYFGSTLVTTFEPGAPYRYEGPDGKGNVVVQVEGEVLSARVGKELVVTHRAGPVWRTGPKVFQSRVAYRLEDVGFATKVSLVQDEIEEGDPGYAHNLEGWAVFLSSLKSFVETGRALPVPM